MLVKSFAIFSIKYLRVELVIVNRRATSDLLPVNTNLESFSSILAC